MSAAAAAAKSLQSCPTLCDPRDRSPPGSPVPGILQARTLEWVAISFSNAWKRKEKVKSLSLETPWTAAHQAPPSMGFSRQEYWSGEPLLTNSLQWTAAHHASLSSISPGVCSNSCPLSRWCHPSISFCHLLLLLPSVCPSIRVFSNELALCIRWPKCFSISLYWVFKVDLLEDWLIWSPWSPRDSQESSPAPQFKSINSLVLSFVYGPTLTSIHGYWKSYSFDYMDVCQQSDVSAF